MAYTRSSVRTRPGPHTIMKNKKIKFAIFVFSLILLGSFVMHALNIDHSHPEAVGASWSEALHSHDKRALFLVLGVALYITLTINLSFLFREKVFLLKKRTESFVFQFDISRYFNPLFELLREGIFRLKVIPIRS